jgi:subfamily B ATP-binding cassette protein MsbA
MDYLKKILKYALPYKKYAFLNIICNVFYALFSTLAMVSLIPMINVIFDKNTQLTTKPIYTGISDLKDYLADSFNYTITSKLVNDGAESTLFFMVTIIISLFLLKNFFGYLAMYFITFLRNGLLKDIRNELFNKIVTLPIAYFSEKRKGDVISRVVSDVGEVQHSFLSILELLVREPLTILFAIIAMLFLSVKLTLFVFIFIPVAGLVISAIGKKLKKQSELAQKERGVYLSILEESIQGLKIIKSYNAENRFFNIFKSSTQRLFGFNNDLMNRQNLASPTSEFLGVVTIATLLWYGGHMVLIEGTLSGGSFIGFMALAYQILTPAKAISKASYSVKRGNASAERVLEIIETVNPLKDSSTSKEISSFEKEITFKNVSFKYEDDYVLKNFSITIEKGKTVALVGQSGSGKSTIANLAPRYYDVTKGEILIDNINIKDLKTSSVRGLMSIVAQDSILFNDTIKENLLVGKQNATDQEIEEALNIANAWEFIKDLPKGINTNVGDSGNKFSGGQKQRLSIARAVLKNPPIMILDEATSALDTESERLVQVALENMMKNRTSIVIAHRLSTIQNADSIIVMHKGEIAEQGNHSELLAKNGIYRKLVEMQSFE